jgi:hypothetical protein
VADNMSGDIFAGITRPNTTFGTLDGSPQVASHGAAPGGSSPAAMAAQGVTPQGMVFMPTTGGSPSTSLLAAVSADEFARMVEENDTRVVLMTEVKIMPPDPRGRPTKAVQNYRYVTSVQGIVLACTTARALQFRPEVRVVNCLGVLYDGRPLGREETS